MPNTVYRKTDAGRLAVAQRSGELASATRHVLILVNGTQSARGIAALGVPDLALHLRTLLQRGLIEPVPAPPPPTAPSPPPMAAPPVNDEAIPDLPALQRRALQLLAPHFGPDTPKVIAGLTAARRRAEAEAALADIEARLAIYLGKRQAARELQPLRAALQEPPPTMTATPTNDRT